MSGTDTGGKSVGSGSATGTRSLATGSVGVKTVQVTAVDVAGNSYVEDFTYRVVYKIDLQYDFTKPGKSGTTLTIKIKRRDANGVDVSSPSIRVGSAGRSVR